VLKNTNRMPALAWAGVVATLCLAGWVAKTTLAQDPPQKTKTAAASELATTPPSLPDDLDVPTIKATEPEPASSFVPSPPLVTESKPAALASPTEPNQVSPRSSLEDIAARNDNSAASRLAASAPADPEKAALVFVAENQKLAESQLKNLKDEESRLKTRLLKVQAGIKRWESLVEALKQSQGSVAVVAPRAPTSRIEPSPEFEPVFPGSNPLINPK
jgi:hypothetical protein